MVSAELDFSIIIPAFNEKDRLPAFLLALVDEIIKSGLQGEVIVVDDGSALQHQRVYADLISPIKNIDILLLRHEMNKGKGAAIQTGFQSTSGSWIGYADADGSTSAREVIRLLKIAVSSEDLDGAFGSRIKMLGYDIDRKFSRHFLGRFFATLAYMLLGIPFYDPQCGCKFFRKSKILPFLKICQERGYLFDIELISLGYLNKLNFLEVPISWKEVAGSKVNIIKDGFKMVNDIFNIRRRLAKKILDEY